MGPQAIVDSEQATGLVTADAMAAAFNTKIMAKNFGIIYDSAIEYMAREPPSKNVFHEVTIPHIPPTIITFAIIFVLKAAACGIDAFIHAEEAYVSTAASPFSDALAEKAMALIGKNILRFVANRNDIEAAEAMMTGSLFAGIAFSFARLGNVHAMSHPVSAFFDVPHGVANAVLLPVIAEYNALADHGKYLTIYNQL